MTKNKFMLTKIYNQTALGFFDRKCENNTVRKVVKLCKKFILFYKVRTF